MTGRKRRAPQTRNHLAAIKNRLARKGATSEEIVAVFLSEHPEVVRAESKDIQHFGLIKLANEVCNLKSAATNNVQLEMFQEYQTGQVVTLRVTNAKGEVRLEKKAVAVLTKEEARQYIVEHSKTRPRQSKRIQEMARLLHDVDKYGEEAWSLERCWRKKRYG